MKYYLVIIQNDVSQAIYSYDNFDDALSAFHTELSYHSEGRNSTVCVILNSYGTVMKNERWIRAFSEVIE